MTPAAAAPVAKRSRYSAGMFGPKPLRNVPSENNPSATPITRWRLKRSASGP
jgi:hypothetical protein